jgi:hypothetical protein
MGTVISLREYRERREAPLAAFERLDLAVAKLDGAIRRRPGRLPVAVERELEVIARAVSSGTPTEAAARAERLAGLLDHPAASGS